MRLVMIAGGAGSGQALLRALGVPTGLPLFHMDHIPWCPGGQVRPRVERCAMVFDGEGTVTWVFESGSAVS